MTNRSTRPEYTAQEEVAETLVELREQLAILRESIHQLRTDMHLIIGRPRKVEPRRSVLRITSLPKDPTAPDFLQRINAVPAEQLDALRAEFLRSGRPKTKMLRCGVFNVLVKANTLAPVFVPFAQRMFSLESSPLVGEIVRLSGHERLPPTPPFLLHLLNPRRLPARSLGSPARRTEL